MGHEDAERVVTLEEQHEDDEEEEVPQMNVIVTLVSRVTKPWQGLF